MKVHAPKVKSRVVASWTGSSRVTSRQGWHSSSVMSSNARMTANITANMNMCIVLQQLDEGTLKQDVLLNSARLTD